MTALAHHPQLATAPRTSVHSDPQTALAVHLAPQRGGYALVEPDGRVVFEAPGADARRRCLDYARRQGVLVILS